MSFLSPRSLEEEEFLEVFELEKMDNQELYDHVLFLHNELRNKNNIIRMYRNYVDENIKTEYLCTKCGESVTLQNKEEKKVFENKLETILQKEVSDYTEYLNIKAEEIVKKRNSTFIPSNWKTLLLDTELEEDQNYKVELKNTPILIANSGGHKIENGERLITLCDFSEKNVNYYQELFMHKDHVNLTFKGNLQVGPMVVSILKEEINERYLVLLRTTQAYELISIDKAKVEKIHSLTKSLPKKIMKAINPSLSIKWQNSDQNKIKNFLINMESLSVVKQFKFGVLLCKEGQRKEEEMFSNTSGGPLFTEFLQLLGKKIVLKGWKNFNGGLDIQSDTTGKYSIYNTWKDYEIMFHVSTLLPYFKDDFQQLERKRHIGNDIVLIVFLDSTTPYRPTAISSNFVHITFVVTVNSLTPQGRAETYKLWIDSKDTVSDFSPPLPNPPIFKKEQFFDFLMHKLINAELACYTSDRFSKGLSRTREAYMQKIIESCSSCKK